MSRLILVFSALLIMFVCLGATDSNAEEGHHTLGAQAGQVGLSGDVGSNYGNALGVGGFFDYAASDWLELELSYLTSRHSQNNLNLTQNDYAVYMIYNIDTLDAFTPYLKGGAEFVGHTQDVVNPAAIPTGISTGQNYTGFGLDIGIGGKFQLASHFSAGLDILYHDLFTVTATPPGGVGSQNVIQSFYTVMLRFGFTFGSDK